MWIKKESTLNTQSSIVQIIGRVEYVDHQIEKEKHDAGIVGN